jgi:hypothetical protein
MKIRMLRAYGAYKAGEVLDVPQRQAEGMIAWEYAAEVTRDQQQTLIETASVEPVAEKAEANPRRRKQ